LDLQGWILQSNYSDPTIQQGVATFSNSQLYELNDRNKIEMQFFHLDSRKDQRYVDNTLEFILDLMIY